MSPSYLVRFDDICPTMNWEVWRRVEETLIEFEIRPILAVVPDNHDPVLQVADPNPDFWSEVRRWQGLGWTIALHGYQHLPLSTDPGIIGLNNKSEFSGLGYEEQRDKLSKGICIFENEGIIAQAWIAPSHSFDRHTVAALKSLGITRISDGMFLYPHTDDDGMLWVPQQLWRFRPAMFGVWTVCCHHNSWNPEAVDSFRRSLMTYRDFITNFADVAQRYSDRSRRLTDTISARLMLSAIKSRRMLRGGRKL